MITRRLFARTAAVSPLAAQLTTEVKIADAAKQAALPMRPMAPMRPPPPFPNVDDKWNLFSRQYKKVARKNEENWVRMQPTGGLSPNIMALRSVSPQHKAKMLGEDLWRRQDRQDTLREKFMRMAGLDPDG